MNKILIVCGLLMVSTVAFADDITVESCADGAGTVITGVVSGHKYCMSNKGMNYWNAVAWCDGQGRRLFSMDDCACSGTTNCAEKCPEMVNVVSCHRWTDTPIGTTQMYMVPSGGGKPRSLDRAYNYDCCALCK
ncbi:MAG: hypothetical protein IKL32_06290 [Alphaproteobacteria bacterium]|nr:hypothetical protein [Alphaproteobacteria bacterium]